MTTRAAKRAATKPAASEPLNRPDELAITDACAALVNKGRRGGDTEHTWTGGRESRDWGAARAAERQSPGPVRA